MGRSAIRIGSLLVSVAIITIVSSPPAVAASDAKTIVEGMAARYRFPGAVLLISGPDREDRAVTGVQDLSRGGGQITIETRFHVASTGKMATAIATLQLVQEKRLSLGDRVLPLIDDIEGARRVPNLATTTLVQLLSHQSGIPDCFRHGMFTLSTGRSGRCLGPTRQGEFSYSNTNFRLLGRILERVEKTSLSDILSERVLRPSGMTDTTVGAQPSDRRLAHGYMSADANGIRQDTSLRGWGIRSGDAPLTTTAPDLAKLLGNLLRPGGQLLAPDMVAAMKVDRAVGGEEGYGLGLEVADTNWGMVYGHSGRFAGFSSEAWYFAAKDTIVILLGNGDERSPDDLLDILAPQIFN